MLRFLLDTNVVIAFLAGKPVALRGRILGSLASDLTLCSVVKAELLLGAAKSLDPIGNRACMESLFSSLASLPFDDAAAAVYDELVGTLEKVGRPIGVADGMIAAIAVANDLTVVTRKGREFRRVHGLRVTEW